MSNVRSIGSLALLVLLGARVYPQPAAEILWQFEAGG
jgi:hypothetical protein